MLKNSFVRAFAAVMSNSVTDQTPIGDPDDAEWEDDDWEDVDEEEDEDEEPLQAVNSFDPSA